MILLKSKVTQRMIPKNSDDVLIASSISIKPC